MKSNIYWKPFETKYILIKYRDLEVKFSLKVLIKPSRDEEGKTDHPNMLV